jgi:pyrrolidone-carboxylate peptidase
VNDRVVIITGFGAFRDYPSDEDNPSNPLATQFAREVSARGLRCECVTPVAVTWEDFAHVLAAQIARHQGSRITWIAFGAGKNFAIETRATNRRKNDTSDATGRSAGTAALSFNDPTQAPDAVQDISLSAVSLLAIQAALGVCGFDVTLSTDAGGYICNAAAYAIYKAQQSGSIETGLFLHTPEVLVREQRDAFARALADILVASEGAVLRPIV